MSAKKEELTDMFTRMSEEEKESTHNVKTKYSHRINELLMSNSFKAVISGLYCR